MQIVENNNECAAFTSCAMTTSYLNTKLKAGSINYHRNIWNQPKYFTCLHLDDRLYVRKLVGGINNS
ncbi:hypothetical protein JCM15640A_21580 [Hoylesella timonensis 4401737 = DSM 22865 = JCM 15640]